MGGRGASMGRSQNGNKYGSQYRTILKSGNIKFVEPRTGATESLLETMTKSRVYVLVERYIVSTHIRDGTAQKGRLDVTVVDKNDPLKRIKVFKDYKIVNNKEVPLERYIVSTQNARLLRGGK